MWSYRARTAEGKSKRGAIFRGQIIGCQSARQRNPPRGQRSDVIRHERGQFAVRFHL